MDATRAGLLVCAVVLAAVAWALLAGPAAAPAAPDAFAVRDVRVFDGERFLPRATVLVRGGLIEAVAADLPVPAGVPVVDGRGQTLLPGLVDAHVHRWGDAGRDALRFGVTTELDMFSDPSGLAAARARRESLAATDEADLWSAGRLATADGGHGSQFGVAVPPVTGPDAAAGWVAARKAEGSDYIKLVREDLHVYSADSRLPSLDDATAAALIRAAHDQGLRAVVHASARDDARRSLQDGADGLVHVFQDVAADEATVALARERGAFVVPTLSVIAAFAGRAAPDPRDPALAPWLSPGQRQALAAKGRFGDPSLLDHALASVRRLHAAGVPLLAGTDAPNPGTAHGVSLHFELRLLAEAGLSPAAALAAATSVPADAFGLADRGRIRPGLRADLVLVRGDPGQDLAATLAITRIWKNGRPVSRRAPGAADTPVLEPGLVSDFDGEALEARVGNGWIATTDRMAGGDSIAAVTRVAGGAEGSAGALRAEGEVRPRGRAVWAGAFYSPAAQMMQPVDARGLQSLSLRVRGDGRALSVLLFSGGEGAPPARQVLPAGPAWTTVTVPLAGFEGADLSRLRALAVTVDAPAGPFWFELDAVEFR